MRIGGNEVNGSPITKKWHEARHGKGPETKKVDCSIRCKTKAWHEARYGKPTAETGRKEEKE